MRGHLLILLKVDSFLHEYPQLGLTYQPMGQIKRWRVTVSPEAFPKVVKFLNRTIYRSKRKLYNSCAMNFIVNIIIVKVLLWNIDVKLYVSSTIYLRGPFIPRPSSHPLFMLNPKDITSSARYFCRVQISLIWQLLFHLLFFVRTCQTISSLPISLVLKPP